jgi:WD40 repeat protein
MWRWAGVLVLVGLGAGGLYWATQAGANAPDGSPNPVGLKSPTAVAGPGDQGAPLLGQGVKKVDVPAVSRAFRDPILITPCNFFPVAEQDLASQVDGTLRQVAVELGQPVRADQLLGRLDDRQLRPQVELLQIKAASRSAEKIARALHDEAAAKVQFAERANQSGLQAVAQVEYQAYLCQRERFAQEMIKAREERREAEKELEKARRVLDLHEIRAGLSGEVVRVFKREGEAVKQAEPLFRVASFERLRLEGLCKISQAGLLRVGMRAVVEPELRAEPLTTLSAHTAPVHGLAVAGDGRLLASAGEDRAVILWRWPGARRLALLPHPSEATAVAFLPPGENGYRLATGCADGVVRLWTVSIQGEVDEPVALPRAHESGVRAVAVSPDGRRLATAGEDKRLGIWDLTSRRLLYWVKAGADGQLAAHQGAVTAVAFTPDGQLVSAGRDNVLKVWQPGEAGAKLVGQQPGRTGDIPQLGISPDGRRLLFDHGEELRILDRADGSCLGTLRSNRQGQFQGVAVFSPTGRLVLTGVNNGRLQLWKVPAGPAESAFLRSGYAHGFHRGALGALPVGPAADLATSLGRLAVADSLVAAPTPALPYLWGVDGYEVRHFLTPNASATCAVFTPDEKVVFTAGTDKVIRAWAVPPASEWGQPLEAEVTFVASQVERGTDLVRVRAELDNPADPARRLRPGTYASLRLYPETAPGPRGEE